METFLFCILTMVVILWVVLIDRDMQIKKASLNGFGGIGYFGETNKYDAFQKCKKIIQSCETYRQLIKAEIVNKSFKKLYDDSFLNGELSNLYDKKQDEIIKKEITELKIHVPLSSEEWAERDHILYLNSPYC